MDESAFNPEQFQQQTSFQSLTLTIRAAQLDDLQDLVELLSTCFHSRTGLAGWFFPILRMGIYEDLRQRLRSPLSSTVCLVAILSQKGSTDLLVGTVEISSRSTYSFLPDHSHYPYLSNLAVSSEYRRQGIAQQLLKHCEEIAKAWGFKDLYLHVLEDNHRAKQLYFKAGFRPYQTSPLWCSWFLKNSRQVLLHKSIPTSS